MSRLMALSKQCVQRCMLKPNVTALATRSTMSTRMSAYEEMSQYWAKNRKLNRPLSPHVTVFKFHLTMAISIANRVAATAQQVVLTGAPILLVCASKDFSHYFQMVKQMDIPSPVILGLKFLVAFPFAFHLMAGMRHLVWDAGVGFGKSATIQGGWVVIAGTLLLTAVFMFALKPTLEERKQ